MVCKIVKKGLIGAALGAGTLALLFGTSAPSYVFTAFHKVRASAQSRVPFEYDIDKARQDVAKLEPAITEAIEALAKANVETEYLDREVARTGEHLNQEGREIVALREHLRTGDVQLTGGITYSPAELKQDLARRFDHHKQLKRILAEKQETLKIRKENAAAIQRQLTEMRSAKTELLTRIEGIETKNNQIKATRAASQFSFDDSVIGRAKAAVAELEKRQQEQVKIDELKARYAEHSVSVTVEPSRDVLKEVDAEFGTGSKGTERTSADRSF